MPYVNFVSEKVSSPFGEVVSSPLVNSHVNVVVVDVRMLNPPVFIVNTDFCSKPVRVLSEFITKFVASLLMGDAACFQTNVPGVVNPVTVQVITSSKAAAVLISAIVVIPEFNMFENYNPTSH